MSVVKTRWVDGELFVGVDSFGHPIVSGSRSEEEPEWAGIKPSDLLLLSLASCSGYDVVTILRKQRQDLRSLEIVTEGKQLSDPPYTFTDIHLKYVFKGKGLSEKAVERAIELSENKYCSVAATVRGVAELSHSYRIEDV